MDRQEIGKAHRRICCKTPRCFPVSGLQAINRSGSTTFLGNQPLPPASLLRRTMTPLSDLLHRKMLAGVTHSI
jgi:hypothetical protein